MQDYVHPNWQSALKEQGLNCFDALWTLDADWFEPPNIRRGGWSGVSRIEINIPGQGSVGLFLKRQENHRSRTWRHPISGITTLEKEHHNIAQLTQHNIPTVTAVYFAQKIAGKDHQAILITEELTGYVSLSSPALLKQIKNRTCRYDLLSAIADIMRSMHAHNFQHNCFFPKHIFVKKENGRWQVKIIDLEKMKRRFSRQKAMLRDLNTLHRHAESEWSTRHRLFLLRCYMAEPKLSKRSKRIVNKIAEKVKTKNRRKKKANL